MFGLQVEAVVGTQVPAAALSVVSTNAPLGIGDVSWSVAVVTALLRVASQSGMLSSVTTFSVAAETFWTDQSVPSVPVTVRQTGSLKVAVTMLPETVKLSKVGRVTSV